MRGSPLGEIAMVRKWLIFKGISGGVQNWMKHAGRSNAVVLYSSGAGKDRHAKSVFLCMLLYRVLNTS
jgi:hypothetical protein